MKSQIYWYQEGRPDKTVDSKKCNRYWTTAVSRWSIRVLVIYSSCRHHKYEYGINPTKNRASAFIQIQIFTKYTRMAQIKNCWHRLSARCETKWIFLWNCFDYSYLLADLREICVGNRSEYTQLFGRGALEKKLALKQFELLPRQRRKAGVFRKIGNALTSFGQNKRKSIFVSTISVTSRNSANYFTCFDNWNFHVARNDNLGFSTLSLLSQMSNWANSSNIYTSTKKSSRNHR